MSFGKLMRDFDISAYALICNLNATKIKQRLGLLQC